MNNLDTKLLASKYGLIYESKYVKVASHVVDNLKEVEGLLNSAYVSYDLFYRDVLNIAKKVNDIQSKNFDSGVKYISNLREKIKSYSLEIDNIELFNLFVSTYKLAQSQLRIPKKQFKLAKVKKHIEDQKYISKYHYNRAIR
jgi:hypothetical protein